MTVRKSFLVLLLMVGMLAVTFTARGAAAAEVIPPKPTEYVIDAAGVLQTQTLRELSQTLKDFEAATSNQVVVAIYPRLPEGEVLEQYTVRVAQQWGVGQKARNNGVVLFCFMQDRKMRIEVGYGLEGALPDSLAKRIIADEITPSFKAGDYDAGIRRGVAGIMAATKGEYKGSGRVLGVHVDGGGITLIVFFGFLLVLVVLIILSYYVPQGQVYSSAGAVAGNILWNLLSIILQMLLEGLLSGGRGSSSGGWSSGGGGWSSGGGGGGGFSSGGGSFGGGGASGSW